MATACYRDESIPYPKIWREFERKARTNTDITYKFVVKDATDSDIPEILQHMNANFLQDEPLCHVLNVRDDPKVLKAFEDFWVAKITERTVLICTLTDHDKHKLSRIIGCNMTFVARADNDNPKFDCETLQLFNEVFNHMDKAANSFKKFETDKILVAAGLSVAKEFRGYGIAVEILTARISLCKALNIPVTTTVFTSAAGQIVAKRAGFELLLEKKFSEIEKDIPGLHITNINHPIIQLMYLKID